ncbi:carboxymuconolactone decarboxylase family protein [Geodermatophilus sp. URMC 62]|uniref:carboxymuconolactone decarboxylase family protein n=1 Tax=Geodermatophilus sp. URMC 62 TaxID=3423414 RepID=UPI00406BE6D6
MSEELTGRPGPAGPPRIALNRPDELDAERARLYEEIAGGPRRGQSSVVPLTDGDGRLLGPFAVMLLAPRVGSAVQAVGAALRFDRSLTERSRELAILTVAAHRRSEFEWLAHESAALATGLRAGQLQVLLDGGMPPDLDAADEVVVRTVRRLSVDGTLDDEGFGEAVSALGTEALATLVWLVGYYGMLATALATFRPPLAADPAG